MREGLNIHNSEGLNNSFEEYRNSPEYKMEVSQRVETLKVFWVFPEFAEALAKDSVKNNFKVSELLWVKDEIMDENDKLVESFSNIEQEKIDRIIRAATGDSNYGSAA